MKLSKDIVEYNQQLDQEFRLLADETGIKSIGDKAYPAIISAISFGNRGVRESRAAIHNTKTSFFMARALF